MEDGEATRRILAQGGPRWGSGAAEATFKLTLPAELKQPG